MENNETKCPNTNRRPKRDRTDKELGITLDGNNELKRSEKKKKLNK